MPLRMPTCTNDWSTDSRWRGGRPWRVASVLAEIGRSSVRNATSTTAAIARSPLRGRRDISKQKTSSLANGSRRNPASTRKAPLLPRAGLSSDRVMVPWGQSSSPSLNRLERSSHPRNVLEKNSVPTLKTIKPVWQPHHLSVRTAALSTKRLVEAFYSSLVLRAFLFSNLQGTRPLPAA